LNSLINLASITLAVFIFTGCTTSNPKVALLPDVKQSIKRIALIEAPDPSKFTLYTVPSIASSPAFLGPIGAVIRIRNFEAESAKFTEAVLPLNPNLNSIFVSQLEHGLKLKGYEVIRVSPPSLTSNGQDYDLAKIRGAFDAVLATSLYGGYWAESGGMTIGVAPRVVASITITAESGDRILFSDSYIYGTQQIGNMIQVIPDQKFLIPSPEEMYADIKLAAEGLKTGAVKIAERVLLDL
jgi:hypothetical protein